MRRGALGLILLGAAWLLGCGGGEHTVHRTVDPAAYSYDAGVGRLRLLWEHDQDESVERVRIRRVNGGVAVGIDYSYPWGPHFAKPLVLVRECVAVSLSGGSALRRLVGMDGRTIPSAADLSLLRAAPIDPGKRAAVRRQMLRANPDRRTRRYTLRRFLRPSLCPEPPVAVER